MNDVIALVDRVTIYTGQAFCLMRAREPVHALTGLVATLTNIVALFDRFTITPGHTDNAVTFGIKM